MTVYDNIAFSLRLKKVPEDEIFERVTNARKSWASPNT
jgi:carbohydrate ABC transporter ATP-binding protein, CUT1 family (TC 3.A.1.1.-)